MIFEAPAQRRLSSPCAPVQPMYVANAVKFVELSCGERPLLFCSKRVLRVNRAKHLASCRRHGFTVFTPKTEEAREGRTVGASAAAGPARHRWCLRRAGWVEAGGKKPRAGLQRYGALIHTEETHVFMKARLNFFKNKKKTFGLRTRARGAGAALNPLQWLRNSLLIVCW